MPKKAAAQKPQQKMGSKAPRSSGHGHSKQSKRETLAMKYKQFRGNKSTGQGFADERKRLMVNAYHKTLKKEKANLQDWTKKIEQLYNEDSKEQEVSVERTKKANLQVKGKVSKFHKAEQEFKKKKEEKAQMQKEFLEKQKEKDTALQMYKTQKKSRHKQLSKKNYKGQPNMASRMDIILQKLENSS